MTYPDLPRAGAPDAELPDVVGTSPAMREVYRQVRLVAPSAASVLLAGETGTGKEMIARAGHRLSHSAGAREPVPTHAVAGTVDNVCRHAG